MYARWPLLVTLGACGPPPPSPGEDSTPSAAADGPSAEAVMLAMDALLAQATALHALPAVETYEQLTREMTEVCPDRFSEPGSVHWSGHCTTSAGVTYSGAGFWFDFAVADFPEERWGAELDELPPDAPRTGREFFGQIDIVHPTLGTLRYSGSAAILAADDGQQRVELSRTEGDGLYSLAPPGSWLSGSLRPELLMMRRFEHGMVTDFRVRGSIAGLEGEVGAARLDIGASTEGEHGKCKVRGYFYGRDADGAWTRLSLTTADEPNCSFAASAFGSQSFERTFELLGDAEPWPW